MARLRAARRRRAVAGRGRAPPDRYLFGMGATFAMADAQMPSMFGALSEVLGLTRVAGVRDKKGAAS